MLSVPASAAIFVHTAPTEFRKAFGSLSGIVWGEFDPHEGSMFVFFNRR